MRVGWVYSPFFLRHRTGASHPERPERLEAIVAALGGERGSGSGDREEGSGDRGAGIGDRGAGKTSEPERRTPNTDSSSLPKPAPRSPLPASAFSSSPIPDTRTPIPDPPVHTFTPSHFHTREPDSLVPLEFGLAPVEWLEVVHDPAYVALVRMACEQGMGFIGDRETDICAESYDVARLAVGGVLAACDAVVGGQVTRAFCAVRPPGHHAGTDQGGGYCLFNNVAIAAEYLRRHHGLPRVAIVDWDVHHGNGTQQIFEARSDVLFISLHETPTVQWPHSGYESERGVGPGEGFTLNCPMPSGSGDAEYRRAFETRVIPALEQFAPSALLISAGFDASAADDIANINLEPASFAWMTAQLAAIADRHCGGRLISVLEGGYDLPSLARGVLAHVREMMNVE